MVAEPRMTTATTNTEAKPQTDSGYEVKGWYLYDPATEDFRQSSVDEEEEDEQNAAQTLVDACEQALDTSAPATTCGHEEMKQSTLMRSSFSFVVSKESAAASSPSSSPLSGSYEKLSPSGTRTKDRRLRDSQHPSSISNSGAGTSESTACSPNNKRGPPSLAFSPPLRETRLSSHRGSVMEAGVVLDTRVFGGIGIVQEGRKVGVRRSAGSLLRF